MNFVRKSLLWAFVLAGCSSDGKSGHGSEAGASAGGTTSAGATSGGTTSGGTTSGGTTSAGAGTAGASSAGQGGAMGCPRAQLSPIEADNAAAVQTTCVGLALGGGFSCATFNPTATSTCFSKTTNFKVVYSLPDGGMLTGDVTDSHATPIGTITRLSETESKVSLGAVASGTCTFVYTTSGATCTYCAD